MGADSNVNASFGPVNAIRMVLQKSLKRDERETENIRSLLPIW